MGAGGKCAVDPELVQPLLRLARLDPTRLTTEGAGNRRAWGGSNAMTSCTCLSYRGVGVACLCNGFVCQIHACMLEWYLHLAELMRISTKYDTDVDLATAVLDIHT